VFSSEWFFLYSSYSTLFDEQHNSQLTSSQDKVKKCQLSKCQARTEAMTIVRPSAWPSPLSRHCNGRPGLRTGAELTVMRVTHLQYLSFMITSPARQSQHRQKHNDKNNDNNERLDQ
jgi:hypothetical protein